MRASLVTSSTSRADSRYSWTLVHVLGLVVVVSVLLLFGSTQRVQAQEEPDRRWNSELCLGCHGGSEDVLTFPSGEEISIDVDGDAFRETHVFTRAQLSGDFSRSFAGGVQCAHCHTNIVRVPHDQVGVPDLATYTTQLATACRGCHWRQYTVEIDETHAFVPLDQRDRIPGCIDCHDPHAPRAITVGDPTMLQACQQCHAGPMSTEIQAIHTLDPTQVEEASAPSVIWFYLSILGAIAVLIGVMWGIVILSERVRARSQPGNA